jgi:hypothetical protein
MLTSCKYYILLSFLLLILAFSSQAVFAGWGLYGPCSPYFLEGGYYSNYSQDYIPYFALHPPVYYSYPVARTYGIYPFPYFLSENGDYLANAIEPKLIVNSYVKQPTTEAVSMNRQALRIANPYVAQKDESSSIKKVSWEETKIVKPKLVYPTKVAAEK